MTSLVFFKNWPWPKVVALCGAWAALLIGASLIAFLRTRSQLGPNDFVYRTSIHINMTGWLLLLVPIALVLLLRWRATR